MRRILLLALLVFCTAFAIRVSLIDRGYVYSFEPDSESCIEVSRSFYFFFKSPSKENLPHTLTSYPNYCDGDFISSAIVANVVRPLCKAGTISAPLTDSDNSLIIYSMRWTGAICDALAAAIAFLIFVLLTGSTSISLLIGMLYYLLNPQTLNIDFIRIDHYTLFAANLTMLAGVLVYKYPQKTRYYLLCGIAAGLVSATKLNFPFYLLITFFTFCFLLYSKKISLKNFLVFCAAGMGATAFMYQRWLMYPEHILDMLQFTYRNGEEWIVYWGTDNYAYYLWDEFFNHGYSIGIFMLMLLGYVSFLFCLVTGMIRKDAAKLILCATFIFQSIILAISPKIGRYGTMMPLWFGVFIAYGAVALLDYFDDRYKKIAVHVILFLYLLPAFGYAAEDYTALRDKRRHSAISISETRDRAALWIKKHISPGSIVAYQYPRVSNAPVFDMPYVFVDSLLTSPFLYKEKLSKFYPPDIGQLKKTVNYIITNDKEINNHFFALKRYECDPSLTLRWQQFYQRLDSLFPHQEFSSAYTSYGLKSIKVYEINKDTHSEAAIITNCYTNTAHGVTFSWDTKNRSRYDGYSFQIQIAEDSCFHWLVSGSRDGFPSHYRAQNDPTSLADNEYRFVPAEITKAMLAGKFNKLMDCTDPQDSFVQFGFCRFFHGNLVYMMDNNASLRKSITHFVKAEDLPHFISAVDSAYQGSCPFWDAAAEDYAKQALPEIDIKDPKSLKEYKTSFKFQPQTAVKHGKKYFWRVRIRDKYTVISDWSMMNSFTF